MSDYRKGLEDAARVCREIRDRSAGKMFADADIAMDEAIDAILALPEPQTEPVARTADEVDELRYIMGGGPGNDAPPALPEPQTEPVATVCGRCNGAGSHPNPYSHGENIAGPDEIQCADCDGTGEIAPPSREWTDEEIWLVVASGEGSTNVRVVRNPDEVRQAYIDFVCGDGCEEELDAAMQNFRDETADAHWQQVTLDLYMAEFRVLRVAGGLRALLGGGK